MAVGFKDGVVRLVARKQSGLSLLAAHKPHQVMRENIIVKRLRCLMESDSHDQQGRQNKSMLLTALSGFATDCALSAWVLSSLPNNTSACKFLQGAVLSLSLSADSSMLVSSGDDGTVFFFKAESCTSLNPICFTKVITRNACLKSRRLAHASPCSLSFLSLSLSLSLSLFFTIVHYCPFALAPCFLPHTQAR